MDSWKCANCGLINFASTATCRRCALPMQNNDTATRPGQPAFNPASQPGLAANYPPPPTPSPMPSRNPNPQQTDYSQTPSYGEQPLYAYQSPYPQTPFIQNGGVWRDQNNVLVMQKQAFLPDRCVKCNAPTDGSYIHRKLSWINPGWYLLVFAGWLIFLIVYLIIRKTAEVDLGLCEKHRAKRRTAILIGWVIAIAGIASIVAAINAELIGLFFLGLLAIIGGLIYGMYAASIINVAKMDDHYIWIKRVDKDFVDSFPPLGSYY